MEIVSHKTETVPMDAVRQHPQNPRRGDVDTIVESIQVNKFYAPLIVQRSSGFILSGNHRFQAAERLGFTEVPVTWVDVDDDTALNILLVDNRSADKGDYDNAKLAELLQARSEVDDELSGTGYDNAFLQDLLSILEEPGGGGGGGGSASPGEPPTPPTSNGYKEQYGVIVICKDEEEQEDVFNRLSANYSCRIVNT